MLVVADSSPFIGLLNIGHIGLMPRLYGTVIIPPEVAAELAGKNKPLSVQQFIAAKTGVLPDLKDAFDKLRATNFRVPPRVLDELLEQYQLFKHPQTERGI